MKFPVQFILSFILFVTFSATTFAQQVSDSSIKTNTAPVTNSLDYIIKLQPVSYEYNRGEYKQLSLPAGKQFGFIANDAKLIVPSAVSNRHNWYTAGKGSQRTITTSEVDLEKLVPLLVGAVKEQQAQIENLKQEVQQLKQSR
jgi:hypothetical protein